MKMQKHLNRLSLNRLSWFSGGMLLAATSSAFGAGAVNFDYQASPDATVPIAQGRAATNGPVSVVITNLGTPIQNGQSLNGFTAYRLTVNVNSAQSGGMGIDAIDAGGASDSTNGIFSASFSQADGKFGSTTVPTPQSSTQNNGPDQFSYDSHFLPDPSKLTFAFTFQEDFNSTNLTGQPTDGGGFDYGQGTKLTGTFGEDSNAPPIFTQDLAYLVLPNAVPANYQIEVAIGNTKYSVSGPVPVPEPVTIGLPALIAAGLLSRRRRRTPLATA